MALTLPDAAAPGDPGHVSDHNLLTAAIEALDLSATRAAAWSASVLDHGAAGGGAADDTAAFQSALGSGASRVVAPRGTYAVTSLSVPAGVVLDLGGSTLLRRSGTASLVVLGAGAALRDGTLDGNSLGGALVHSAAAGVLVERVTGQGSATATAFSLVGAASPVLLDCSSAGVKYGVLLSGGTTDAIVVGGTHSGGTATSTYEASVYVPAAARSRLVGVVVSGSAGHGYSIDGASSDTALVGCVASDCGASDFDHSGIRILSTATRTSITSCTVRRSAECGIYSSSGTSATRITGSSILDNNQRLRAGGHGIEMGGSSAVTGCLVSGQLGDRANAGCGIFTGAAGTSVTGCRIEGNWGHGIRVVDSAGATLAGNVVRDNSCGNAGNHDGIQVIGLSAGSCNDVAVTGNRCTDTQGTKTQRYGISLANAYVDYCAVTGNACRGNLTGGVVDSGGGGSAVANNT